MACKKPSGIANTEQHPEMENSLGRKVQKLNPLPLKSLEIVLIKQERKKCQYLFNAKIRAENTGYNEVICTQGLGRMNANVVLTSL